MRKLTKKWHIHLMKTIGNTQKNLHLEVTFVYEESLATNGIKPKNIEDVVYEKVLSILTKNKIKSIIPRFDPTILNEWIIRKITATCGREYKISESKCYIDGQPGSIIRPTYKEVTKKGGNALKRILNRFEARRLFGNQNANFTTKRNWAIANKIASQNYHDFSLVTFVCPPYTKTMCDGLYSGYDGLCTEFNKDPLSYNFDYDYFLYLDVLEKIRVVLGQNNLKVNPIIVLGDWALVDLDGVKKSLINESGISIALETFKKSMVDYCQREYPHMRISSFQELGVPDYLPIGFSMDPSSRLDWIATNQNSCNINWIEPNIISYCLKNMDDLLNCLDWREYKKIVLHKKLKIELIKFLKTFHNIMWIRVKEYVRKENISINLNLRYIMSKKLIDIRRMAYVDALLRYLEYKLYGKLFVDRYGSSICCYQDMTFTAAGICFENDKLPVLFIDPYKVK